MTGEDAPRFEVYGETESGRELVRVFIPGSDDKSGLFVTESASTGVWIGDRELPLRHHLGAKQAAALSAVLISLITHGRVLPGGNGK